MNSDANTPSSDDKIITYTYDSKNKLMMTSERITSVRITTYNNPAELPAERFRFEHDSEAALGLTTPDGKSEYFRDNPKRYLVVEPNRRPARCGR